MSYLLEKARTKVRKLEEELEREDLKDGRKQILDEQLGKAKEEVKKYQKLELMDLDKIATEMKIIKGHIKAVDDKYNCRTVKFMLAVADFLDKPRSISKSLAKGIRDYITTKINAPVCSIAGSPKPVLEPMPSHVGPKDASDAEWRRKELEELMKFRDISSNYLESKPSRLDRLKAKLNAFKQA